MAFRSPLEVFAAYRLDEVRSVLADASAAAANGRYVAGFVAYEAAAAFDSALKTRSPVTPLVWMAAYDGPSASPFFQGGGCLPPADGRFAYDADRYADVVSKLRSHIREGDVYQINFTGPLDFLLRCPPYVMYERLLRRQPVPYAAYIDTGEIQVMSCSPELFFEKRGRCIATRPMKGTVRRGRRAQEDDELERWLLNDEKSRAENLMIVDLLRNDLSRCCEPGTVRVSELFSTERYRTVIQMTSEIQGTLRPGATTDDVFAALFPCGSVTGAPKVRTMELIERYEPAPRGIYCGAIGFMHGERAVFSVTIRTATVCGDQGRLGIGSGIVWDSEPAAEYEECLLKARFLTDMLEEPTLLIETMRSRGGEIPLLDRHVDRLRDSSRTLGYPFDARAFRAGVAEATPHMGDHKVRVTLAPEGSLTVDVRSLSASASEWTATISDERIYADDLYRRHKTTRREMYDDAYRAARSRGFDEVIFLNERGEVAEGSRSNVVVVFGDRWVTPPIACGALPGVYRRFLLETREYMEEAVVTLDDLRRCDVVYLCNAVRGLVRTRFSLAPEAVEDDVR